MVQKERRLRRMRLGRRAVLRRIKHFRDLYHEWPIRWTLSGGRGVATGIQPPWIGVEVKKQSLSVHFYNKRHALCNCRECCGKRTKSKGYKKRVYMEKKKLEGEK